MEVVEILGLLTLGALFVLTVLVWRRVLRIRREGIDVAMRTRPDRDGSRWYLGIGHYHGETFAWYRVTGLGSGPDIVLRRAGLVIVSRRAPAGSESYAMPSGATVLRCRSVDGELELAMAPDALTGFLSWLESAPPGRAVPWAS